MLTGLLIILPLVASLLIFLVKGNNARVLALGASLAEFILSLVVFMQYKANPEINSLHLNYTWVESLGIHFSVGIDGIGLLLVLLTTFLVPLIILSSFQSQYNKPNAFYGLILMMQMALIGVFTANDGFLFYVFWELALIPIYFIAALWGGENRIRITFKFFLFRLSKYLAHHTTN